ncbi:hypothetical protein ACLOJK_034198 [Asimina triloba]
MNPSNQPRSRAENPTQIKSRPILVPSAPTYRDSYSSSNRAHSDHSIRAARGQRSAPWQIIFQPSATSVSKQGRQDFNGPEAMAHQFSSLFPKSISGQQASKQQIDGGTHRTCEPQTTHGQARSSASTQIIQATMKESRTAGKRGQ